MAPDEFSLEGDELTHLKEVREYQSKNLKKALTWSSMGHLSVVVLVLLVLLAKRNAPQNERTVVVPYRELQAPPSLQNTPPPVTVSAPAAQPTAGIPLPTEDEQVQEEQTIATQEELSQTIGTGETAGNGDSLVIAPPSDALPQFGEYVYVEELPEAITKVSPEYPDIARQSSMEGTVVVQVWSARTARSRTRRSSSRSRCSMTPRSPRSSAGSSSPRCRTTSRSPCGSRCR